MACTREIRDDLVFKNQVTINMCHWYFLAKMGLGFREIHWRDFLIHPV